MEIRLPSTPLAALCAAFLLTAASARAATDADWKTPPPDAVRHPSGLVTQVLQEGQGKARPDANDLVSARFIARTMDGKEVMNTYDDKAPRGFLLSQVFPGWRETLMLMVQGEKRRSWIPAELAPQSGSELARQPIVFDVELFGLIPVPDPPKQLDKAPAEATRLSTGVSTLRLDEGFGTAHPIDSSAALVDYVVWSADGAEVDSSYPRLRPTLLPLAKVNFGLASCVKEMVEGESRLCWLPANVANGEWKGSPKGPLVFHLVLRSIGDASKMFDGAKPEATPPPGGGSGG